MTRIKRIFLYIIAFLIQGTALAVPSMDCRPLPAGASQQTPKPRYGQGLLFKLSRPGSQPSHVFGTIHLSDERLVTLPLEVARVLDASRSFTMEAMLDERAIIELSDHLFYQDGTRLSDQLGAALFQRVASLLARQGIPEPMAQIVKPWGAYVILSMPPSQQGLPMDMVLMQRAQTRGASVYGLETVREQAETLGNMALTDQVALLKDVVCHYEAAQQLIAEMTSRYLKRDLAGLMVLANRFKLGEEYTEFMERLLFQRNRRMVKRMAARLAEGNAFIAIGALHLPGDQGVLALLEQQGYEVSVVY